MTAPFLSLISDARRAGLTAARLPDGQLVIRGPRAQESLVRALLDRKAEVLTVLPVFNGEAPRLDWRRGRGVAVRRLGGRVEYGSGRRPVRG